MTFDQVLAAWLDDETFRLQFIQQLTSIRFPAYRWECPRLSLESLQQPFRCVFIDSPELLRGADPGPFSGHFRVGQDLVSFPSLAGDALLIVPQPTDKASNYGHLAQFLGQAPAAQIHRLWQEVARCVRDRLQQGPLWLNTSGLGVAWLHIRLDDRPKYYAHRPYCG